MIPGVSQINRLCHSQLRLLLRAKEGKKRPKIVNSNHRTEGKEAIKETEHLMKKVGEQERDSKRLEPRRAGEKKDPT